MSFPHEDNHSVWHTKVRKLRLSHISELGKSQARAQVSCPHPHPGLPMAAVRKAKSPAHLEELGKIRDGGCTSRPNHRVEVSPGQGTQLKVWDKSELYPGRP